MASKRTLGADSMASAGSAAARAKTKVTRKHRSVTATVETSANAIPAESPDTQPALEEIAQLAYSYWEARGYQGGSPEDDWLRAEREVRSQLAASATA